MVYTDRLLGILMLGIVGLLVYLATKQIKRGRHIKIREIGGLQALEEALVEGQRKLLEDQFTTIQARAN